MVDRAIYQTLEDRGNPDSIEEDGPFRCKRPNAWLGEGYYFWESFIENSHWWGRECNNYKDGYVICEALYTDDGNKCYNLVDNPEHLRMLNDTISIMEERGLYRTDKTTVARIIEYLRNTLKIFHYEAIRAYPINSKSYKSEFSSRIVFDPRTTQKYLNSLPEIQICFFSKSSLNLRNYRIVFPDEYIDGYVV